MYVKVSSERSPTGVEELKKTETCDTKKKELIRKKKEKINIDTDE